MDRGVNLWTEGWIQGQKGCIYEGGQRERGVDSGTEGLDLWTEG
jgi:hypothetical protein